MAITDKAACREPQSRKGNVSDMQHPHVYGWVLFALGILIASVSFYAVGGRPTFWRVAVVLLSVFVGVSMLILSGKHSLWEPSRGC